MGEAGCYLPLDEIQAGPKGVDAGKPDIRVTAWESLKPFKIRWLFQVEMLSQQD
jgi:hypothetical protein